MADILQFRTTQVMKDKLRNLKDYGHILGHDATDNISGYETYKYHRDRGYDHLTVLAMDIFSFGRNPWGLEEYRAAEQRYEDERL